MLLIKDALNRADGLIQQIKGENASRGVLSSFYRVQIGCLCLECVLSMYAKVKVVRDKTRRPCRESANVMFVL